MAGVEKAFFATLTLLGSVILVGQTAGDYIIADRSARFSRAISQEEYRQRRAEMAAAGTADAEIEPDVPAVRIPRWERCTADNFLKDCEADSPARSLAYHADALAIK